MLIVGWISLCLSFSSSKTNIIPSGFGEGGYRSDPIHTTCFLLSISRTAKVIFKEVYQMKPILNCLGSNSIFSEGQYLRTLGAFC